MGIMIFMLKLQRRALMWPNNLCARLYIHNIYIYIDIETYKICVEVFEKTVSPTEMIDHSFERKFYKACHRLCLKSMRGSSRAQRARNVLKWQFYYDAIHQSL